MQVWWIYNNFINWQFISLRIFPLYMNTFCVLIYILLSFTCHKDSTRGSLFEGQCKMEVHVKVIYMLRNFHSSEVHKVIFLFCTWRFFCLSCTLYPISLLASCRENRKGCTRIRDVVLFSLAWIKCLMQWEFTYAAKCQGTGPSR